MISFPKPDTIYFGESKRIIAQSMLFQMLASGNCATPGLFLDKDDINASVQTAYACGEENKPLDVPNIKKIPAKDTSSLEKAVESLCQMAQIQPVGCLMEYSMDEDSLCVVGSGDIYYIIDLTSGVFCQATQLVKELQQHIEQRGDGTLKFSFFTEEIPKEKEEEEEEQVPSEPEIKKKKPRSTKKTTTDAKKTTSVKEEEQTPPATSKD